MKNNVSIRVLDILLSSLGLIFISPILLIVALLIKLDSKGPIIFKQKRMGKALTEFEIYKFRTMIVNAEKLGPKSTQLKDKRITKIGKILRKTSLDELPQLLNVIKGEMSLVGPRPGVREHVDFLDVENLKRYNVEPGITGYAQIYGRSNCTKEEKKMYDLKYVDEKSFCLNLKILLLTVKMLFSNKGSW